MKHADTKSTASFGQSENRGCLFVYMCLDVHMPFRTLTLSFLCLLGGRSRPIFPEEDLLIYHSLTISFILPL